MKKEQEYFLKILGNHLTNQRTDYMAGLDWTEILHYSKDHQLGGIVYYQCKSFIPRDVRPAFEKMYASDLYYYVVRKEAMKDISLALHASGISFYLVKGSIIDQYYPVPALRTMGDLDFVIHTDDRLKTCEIMQNLGFDKITYWDNKELGFTNQLIGVEIHDHLIYQQVINQPALEEFFENHWTYVRDGKLDNSFHFLYLLLHLRKHFLNTGIGFRMFMDLALMESKELSLNWQWIRDCLHELGLLEFATKCFAFINCWFGIPSPLEEKITDKEFYELATKTVFANGVFGFNNTENRINEAVNIARKGNNPQIQMMKRAVLQVFPPYSMMMNNEKYHFAKKKIWLLPAAWLYRIIRSIRMVLQGRRRVFFRFASKEQLKTRDGYLKKWGL